MLVDPRWLHEWSLTAASGEPSRSASNGLVVADVRWVPDGHAVDRYRLGHLPGAVCVDVDTDLAAPAFHGPGRHPLPSPEAFAASMARLGIGDDTRVVAYDDVGGWVAARLWWMLRVLDHDVALLDLASLDVWARNGWTLEVGQPRAAAPVAFTPAPWPASRVVDADAVRRTLREGSAVVIDARSNERYRGETEPIDPVAGHIPGAVSAEWAGNLDERGCVLDPDALRRRYEALGVRDDGEAVASCGSGIAATFALFAMERAGLGLGRLYEGSWSDWISDPARRVATGAAPGEMT